MSWESSVLPPTLSPLGKTGHKFVSSLERYVPLTYKTDNHKAGWGILSLVWMMTSGMRHRPKSHHLIILLLDFINSALFLAVWIVLAIEVSCNTARCSDPNGGHLHINPCNTLYGAFGLSIAVWILFTISLGFVSVAIRRERKETLSTEK